MKVHRNPQQPGPAGLRVGAVPEMPGGPKPDLLEEVLGLDPFAGKIAGEPEDIVLMPVVNIVKVRRGRRLGFGVKASWGQSAIRYPQRFVSIDKTFIGPKGSIPGVVPRAAASAGWPGTR